MYAPLFRRGATIMRNHAERLRRARPREWTFPPEAYRADTMGKLRTLSRTVGILAGFALAGFVLVNWSMAAKKLPGELRLGVVKSAERQTNSAPRDHSLTLFVGDSLWQVRRAGLPAPAFIRSMLKRQEPETKVHNLSLAGATLFSHYFLSERIAELEPARLIVGINLHAFGRDPEREQRELAALLPPSRWTEAAQLPLELVHLSAADVVSSHIALRLGLLPARLWLQGVQVRFGHRVSQLAISVNERHGSSGSFAKLRKQQHWRRNMAHGMARLTENAAQRRFLDVMEGLEADEPRLRILDRTLARFRESGARILLVVQPLNVDHLTRLGVYDAAGMKRSLQLLGEIAARHEAEILDLHHTQPDEMFDDMGDHLLLANPRRPGLQAARAMLPWIRRSRPALQKGER